MSADSLFSDPAPERWDKKPETSVEWKGTAVIYGPPQTQGSKRGFVHPTKKYVMIVDDNAKALKSWRADLVDSMRLCRPRLPIDTAVAIDIMIYVKRPRGHYGSGKNAGELKPSAPILPAIGKDVDKVERAVFDAGKDAGWWSNDARIVDARIRRRFDADSGGERTLVWAWTITSGLEERPDFSEPEEADIEY